MTEKENIKAQEDFMEYLNREVLFLCDFERLSDSYNRRDYEYPKELLKQMHHKFCEIYSSDELTEDMDFVLVPAVIKPRKYDKVFIGIVQLDLTSSGEHYGTDFFTGAGVLNTDNESLPDGIRKYLMSLHPYDYYPTVPFDGDIHVDWSKCPDEAKEMIDFCRNDGQEQTGGMNLS